MHCAIARVKIACIYAMQLALLSNHPHNHGLEGSSHHERKGGGGKDYGKKSSVKRMSSQNPAFFYQPFQRAADYEAIVGRYLGISAPLLA